MIPIKDNIPTRRFPLINWIIIILNIAVFVYELTLSQYEIERFVNDWGFLPVDLIYLDWINIITAMFIHAGFVHIFGNMLFLYVFGDNVEDVLGKFRYLILYFLSGFGAAIIQASVSLLEGFFYIPMVGASGAVSGVLATYVKFYHHAKILTFIPPFPILFVLPAWFFIGYWFFIQVLFALVVPTGIGGVAWYAHVGGFMTGWFLSDILFPKKNVKLVHYSTLR